ncbi:hypothetical protein TNCV_3403471 [Trichonephila clavipes]|nr:hypothetical protein TNCV_3403471 [Trichonephila clavipes]
MEKKFKQVIGKSGLHDLSNDNGKQLTDFEADHNMVIQSTMFQHKGIHKINRRSPDRGTCNQIDIFWLFLDTCRYTGCNKLSWD